MITLAVCLGASFARGADHVLTVGGVNPDYTDIQSAVQAAALGDVVLVRAGSYAGFIISAKSVSVIADPEGSVTINGAVVVQLQDSTQPAIVLSGLHIVALLGTPLSCLDVGTAIRCVALDGTAVGLGFPGANIFNCSDVALTRCTFQGGTNPHAQYAGGDGVDVGNNSKLALHDCSVQGGAGADGAIQGSAAIPPVAGPHGVHVWSGGTLFASGTLIRGGAGGAGTPAECALGLTALDGAAGGAGVYVDASSTANLIDDDVAGGPGGAGGGADPSCGSPAGQSGASGLLLEGNATLLAGAARALRSSSVLREFDTLALAISGQPGDQVLLRIARTGNWTEPAGSGPLLVGNPSRRILLGTIPAGGVLNCALPLGDLGAGIESRTLHLQAICIDSSGQAWRSGAQPLVLLDSSY